MLSRRTPLMVRAAGMALARQRRASMGVGGPYVAAARFAWANRGRMASAARVIGRAYRSYRKRKRENPRRGVGEAVSRAVCKTERMQQGTAAINTRTCYFINLLGLQQGVQDNQRLRDRANVRGFRVNFVFRNDLNERVVLNYALVSPKQAATVTLTSFFRDAGTLRDVDFSTLQSGMVFNFNGLNPDKFKVLTHRRITLQKSSEAIGREKTVTRYFTLKRHIPFSDQSGVSEASLFWVYWLDGTLTAAGGAVQVNAGFLNQNVVAFFKDPKT